MSHQSAIAKFAQLCFELIESHSPLRRIPSVHKEPLKEFESSDTSFEQDNDEDEDEDEGSEQGRTGRDDELEAECRAHLRRLGIVDSLDLVTVRWNPRLRSTAGYASFPSWRIELNPRLIPFEGQVDRTLKHELAHLIAYHRNKRRRIDPHGREWQQACADLGIAGEPAHHRLPFPRATMQRNHAYQCPSCKTVVGRVRPFKRATACLACCRKYAGGAFDPRFKFVKVPVPEKV